MTSDPASLSNLRDLAMPPPASFWPPAPGAVILAVALCAVAATLAWGRIKAYRADAYRRQALNELGVLHALPALEGDSCAAQIAGLLKRTALAAFPRDAVAGLTGPAWVDFLVRSCNGESDRTRMAAIIDSVYRAAAPAGPEREAIFEEARIWVRRHTAPNRRGE